jgi:hypothetical protein
MPELPTPKQPQPEHLKDWYPYYAGYTEAFASAVLEEHFTKAASIFDPWNGSGTTTAAAAQREIKCIGIDINPVMTVISRARVTPSSVRESLRPIALEIVDVSTRCVPPSRASEPLGRWLRAPAVAQFRQLQSAIHHVLMDSTISEMDLVNRTSEAVADLPILPCFFYAALFASARDVLKPFRSTNPTWIRYPASPQMKLNPSAESIVTAFLTRVEYLTKRLRTPTDVLGNNVRFETGSLQGFRTRIRYDGCLTSPPYATRVDYVKSTLAELSVLGVSQDAIIKLRSDITGTPIVKSFVRPTQTLQSTTARRLISAVAKHPSHGSKNYYTPWLEKYICDLEKSLATISDLLNRKGRIAILVQDSHYKSEKIDLQAIVGETLEANGLSPIQRIDFRVRHSMASMNPASRKHPKRMGSTESLLIYDK